MRQTLTMIFCGVAAIGCATFGPKANVSLMKEEVAKTKSIDNVVIPSVTGIDSTGNTGKTLLAAALGAYGNRGRPTLALSALLNAIPGVPQQTGDLVLAGYQAEFARIVEKFRKDGIKPSSLKIPNRELNFEIPNGLEGIRAIAPKLQGESQTLSNMAQTYKSGDTAALAHSLDQSKIMRPMLQRMAEVLLDQTSCNYVLLTHVAGSEQDWEGGKEVQLFAAMVNVKTGAFRYFADVKAKKGSIPVPYMAQLGTMSGSLFNSAIREDPISDDKDASKAAEKLPSEPKKAIGMSH